MWNWWHDSAGPKPNPEAETAVHVNRTHVLRSLLSNRTPPEYEPRLQTLWTYKAPSRMQPQGYYLSGGLSSRHTIFMDIVCICDSDIMIFQLSACICAIRSHMRTASSCGLRLRFLIFLADMFLAFSFCVILSGKIQPPLEYSPISIRAPPPPLSLGIENIEPQGFWTYSWLHTEQWCLRLVTWWQLCTHHLKYPETQTVTCEYLSLLGGTSGL